MVSQQVGDKIIPIIDPTPLQNRRIARVSTIPFSMLTQMRPQLEAIHQAGGEITLIASADALGDELKQLNYCAFKPTYISREINFFADLLTLFRLWELFGKQRFDIVHSITPKAGLLCAIAARLAGIPIRLHTYTGQPWVTMHGFKKFIVKYCDKLISMLTTQCYTDSLSQKHFLIQNKIINAEKIKVLGSGSLAGIDLARFNQDNFSAADKRDFRKQLDIQEKTLVFIFVGRVTEDKGVYELLESTSHLLALGYDIALLIVGPFEQRLEREIPPLAHKLCGNKVICTGFSKEPERFMAIADVLCIPSYREGFGTVVIEAAAMGLPTIGTNIYGLTDAVVDGETGILVDSKNVLQLTATMKQLADNSELRKQLGECAKKRAVAEFDSQVCGKMMVMEYNALLNKSLPVYATESSQ
ncbi:MAG: glycosyl transferase family 1 [Verrucomicrobia bacterium RIFCSPHIGHO2_12_FULL_41_10]|nr:MAG: glycosyl transferase family 1 [Verrucomicrobia bacterium RIFCSPHIGHO2_12_FULL_41_10]